MKIQTGARLRALKESVGERQLGQPARQGQERDQQEEWPAPAGPGCMRFPMFNLCCLPMEENLLSLALGQEPEQGYWQVSASKCIANIRKLQCRDACGGRGGQKTHQIIPQKKTNYGHLPR